MTDGKPRQASFLVALLAAALMMITLGAAATNASWPSTTQPFDDDAGSGRDAGDDPDGAVLLEPAAYEGNLTAGVDRRDHYRFVAPAGTTASVSFSATGPVELHLRDPAQDTYGRLAPGRSGAFVLPAAGEWFLVATYQAALPPATAVGYAFSFALDQLPHHVVTTTDAAWQTTEVRWEDADEFVLHIWSDPRYNPFRTSATVTAWAVAASGSGAPNPGFPIVYDYRVPAAGHQAGATPVVMVDVVDDDDKPYRVLRDDGNVVASAGFTYSCTACSGEARLRLLRTDPATPWHIGLASTNPVDQRTASGDDIITMRAGDPEDTLMVGGPGLLVSGERSATFHLDPAFTGGFVPHGTSGTITAPDGTRTTYDCTVPPLECSAWLDEIRVTGNWTFELAPRLGHGDTADLYQLVGAHYPRLGLYTADGRAAANDDPAERPAPQGQDRRQAPLEAGWLWLAAALAGAWASHRAHRR